MSTIASYVTRNLMNGILPPLDLQRNSQMTRQATNRRLLREVYHDAPNIIRDRHMAKHDKIRFFAHHNSLVRLADNNHELLVRLAGATGNPGLQKAANSPGWIHFAAEHPRLFRFGADTGLIQRFSR